jgi:hypothetical protein
MRGWRRVSYVVVAVVVGIVIGYLTGGRLTAMGEADLRWPAALYLGIGIQVASLFLDGALGTGAVVVSYLVLMLFAARNVAFAGMGIVLVGVALNALVIGVNSGMPVRGDAIVASGYTTRDALDEIRFDDKRHLERDDDRLTFLGDIIPIPGVGEVLSFGDLVMSVGVADVIVHLMRTNRRRNGGAVRPPAREASESTGSG